MKRSVVILEGAKADFRDIKKFVKKHFGEWVWAEVNQEFKNTIELITTNPMLGASLEELAGLGFDNFRKALVRQTRVVYEFDAEQLVVHMFIHTKKDFKTHLANRLLAPS